MLRNLKDLRFTSCSFERVPLCITAFQELKYLSFADNVGIFCGGHVASLPNLQNLNLQYCFMKSIHYKMKLLKDDVVVNLERNAFPSNLFISVPRRCKKNEIEMLSSYFEPIQKCKRMALWFLHCKKEGLGEIGKIPKDIVLMIAQYIWASRK